MKHGILLRYAHGLYGLPGLRDFRLLIPCLDEAAYVTGRYGLFVNSTFTKYIKGMGRKEGAALLEMLKDHIAGRPEFHVRFKWEPGSVAFWDNRCTQHYAVADYFPQHRLMHRVTIAGDRPVG